MTVLVPVGYSGLMGNPTNRVQNLLDKGTKEGLPKVR